MPTPAAAVVPLPAAPKPTPVVEKPVITASTEKPVEKPVERPAAVAKPAAPVEKAAAATKPEAPAEKPATKAAAPKEVAPAPKPSTLDLAALEQRLKDTSAIGVFTKLTLKNQVDDLISRFRAHYQGQSKTSLAALRQPYDQLVMKVLALLQDGDPLLARAIADSREAIWGILSDPDKFKKL